MDDTTPIYNLKAVMHEVGLSAATLRAWEQRYGLPKPKRTAGGHRLYSRQDIELLRWLIEQKKEGLSISRAVELWKSSSDQMKLVPAQAGTTVLEKSVGDDRLDELRKNWISACVSYNNQAAEQVLDQAFSIAAPETVCLAVLQKGLSEIGEMWYSGTFSVQQEHFASAIALRRINHLMAALPPPNRHGRILAACPPGEQHDFSLLLATYLLRRNGWEVVYLGANVPLQDLDLTIRSTHPRLIITCAQTINSAASLRLLSEANYVQDVPLAYGGGIFEEIPRLIQFIQGHYLGPSVANISQEVEQMLETAPVSPKAQPVPANYRHALEKFRLSGPEVNVIARSTLGEGLIAPHLLEMANTYLNQLIVSGLVIGDLTLLDRSVEWLTGMLLHHGYSLAVLQRYFSAYLVSVSRVMGSEGSVITDWLAKHALRG